MVAMIIIVIYLNTSRPLPHTIILLLSFDCLTGHHSQHSHHQSTLTTHHSPLTTTTHHPSLSPHPPPLSLSLPGNRVCHSRHRCWLPQRTLLQRPVRGSIHQPMSISRSSCRTHQRWRALVGGSGRQWVFLRHFYSIHRTIS